QVGLAEQPRGQQVRGLDRRSHFRRRRRRAARTRITELAEPLYVGLLLRHAHTADRVTDLLLRQLLDLQPLLEAGARGRVPGEDRGAGRYHGCDGRAVERREAIE